ncbi:amidohydrolase family protein [Actinospongicola halichondriae]|uniref:amidohydrolase family protein n=1 Tax=Actinospongicola halichondriae TaxID=3236844 RepID=UPI003D4A252F
MSSDRFLVISADCHAGLPNAEYREWLDPAFHDAFAESLEDRERQRQLAMQGFLNKEFADEWAEENEDGLRGSWDAVKRDRELDNDGVVGEVIFPDGDSVSSGASAPFGAGLGQSGETPPEHLLAGARAHNRWLAELCATSPERRRGIAVVPIAFVDVDVSVAEIRRAHESGLRGGILIPPMWQPGAPYHDQKYDPIWAVCQELDLPVHVHSGPADKASYGPHIGIYTAEVRFWSSRPLWFLIWSGVFERFPRLKFAVTECGAFWVNDLLWRMDSVFEREHGSKKLGAQLTTNLSMRPSDYFDRNCFIGASNTHRRELERRYEIGVGNLMWGNDFPHPEGTWPHTAEFLHRAFNDIPEDEARAMLGGTAAEVYGFDVAELQPLVDEFGPTAEALGQTEGRDLSKWDALRESGRPWLTEEGSY